MFCTNCGTQAGEGSKFCANCGRPFAGPTAQTFTNTAQAGPVRRLERTVRDKWIGGVCSGFARYLEVDITIVRLLWLATVILAGTGVLAYIICWIIIPREATPAYSA